MTELDELYARRARLESERDGTSSIKFPEDVARRESSEPVVAAILEGERIQERLERRSRRAHRAGEVEPAGPVRAVRVARSGGKHSPGVQVRDHHREGNAGR